MSEVLVSKDERLTQRSPEARVARLTSAEDPEGLDVRVQDAGPGGLRAISPIALARGTRVRCAIDTDEGPMGAEGVVAWQLTEGDEIHVGIRFTFVDPELSLWLAEEVRAHRRAQIAAVPAPAAGPVWEPETEPESEDHAAEIADEPVLEVRPTMPDPPPLPDLDTLLSEELGPLANEIIGESVVEPEPVAEPEPEPVADPEPEPVLLIQESKPHASIVFETAEPEAPAPEPRKSHRIPRASRPPRTREMDITVETKIESTLPPRREDATPLRPRSAPVAAPVSAPAEAAAEPATITIRLPKLKLPKVSLAWVPPMLRALAIAGAWAVERVKRMGFWRKLERRSPRMHRWAKRRVPLLLAFTAVGFLVGSALLVLVLRDGDGPAEGTAAAGADSYWDLPVAAVAVERGTPPLPPEAASLPRRSPTPSKAPVPAAETAAPIQAAAALPALPPVAPPEEAVPALEATSPTADEVGDIEAEAPGTTDGSPFPGAPTLRLRLSGDPEGVNHYPLANPNGIVIDVPGRHHPGHGERLEPDHPLIRFVKIIERDDGVRFIIYLRGPLPPYEIVPAERALRIRFPGHAVEE